MDLENRQDRLEDRFGELEHRQYSFEKTMAKEMAEFKAEVRMYIKKNDEEMRTFRETMSKLDDRIEKLSDRMHNLTIATAIGVATIVITIVLTR